MSPKIQKYPFTWRHIYPYFETDLQENPKTSDLHSDAVQQNVTGNDCQLDLSYNNIYFRGRQKISMIIHVSQFRYHSLITLLTYMSLQWGEKCPKSTWVLRTMIQI